MNLKIEQKILEEKLNTIDNEIAALEEEYKVLYKDTIETRENLATQRSSLKQLEVINELRKVNRGIVKCNRIDKKIAKLKISRKSPYFASIIFDDEEYYIGKLGIQEQKTKNIVVYDWRAPISNLFYDFEPGKAYYIVPQVAKIEGTIEKKKQYKIEKSKLIYCFETNIQIEDDILQQTLAENSSEHMKTIVASIQKEQNAVIRKPKDETLIVQGVAGSGKTSIALHRIAYLLYNNKKELKSNKVLIFSPNKVFSNYISTVLPELGEKNAKETNMDELLEENFGGILKIRKKYESIESLLKNEEKTRIHNIKTSVEFFNNLCAFLNKNLSLAFSAKDITIKKEIYLARDINKIFKENNELFFSKKLNLIAERLISICNIKSPLTNSEENSLKKVVLTKLMKMVAPKDKNILKLYYRFLKEQNLPTFSFKGKIDFEDAINLLFIKNYIFGADVNKSINHIVIDELQDYSPCALSIISETYPCSKTALGDLNQTVDKSVKKDMTLVASKILDAKTSPIVLNTSYRSSKQIGEFCNNILDLKSVKLINRKGEDVKLINCTKESLYQTIQNQINVLQKKYKFIGIISKTYKDAYNIGKELKIKTISPITQKYKTGIISTPAYLAKGLEFDAVIVFNVNDENFKTELDKQQLYVAATRALHSLTLVYSGKKAEFIK